MRLTLFASSFLIVNAFAVLACSSSASSTVANEESDLNQDNDIFAKVDAFPVTISAPFSTLFARYKAGKADPPPAADPDAGDAAISWEPNEFSEPAKLVFNNAGVETTLDLRVYVRGESSKNDCPFMKLKLDFSGKEQLKKTPFKGHGKMRLNTHCGPGDASARSKLGRVFNGVGPVREELTYRLIRAASIPTYRTRVIAVRYDDTADKTQLDSFGMLVESGDDAAQRFAKMTPPLIAPEATYLEKSAAGALILTPENTAQISIAEAFSGNKDWGGTHNTDSFGVVGSTNGLRIAQDFDLGAITLGDIANYWKGVAPVSDAKAGLANATVAASIRPRQADMEAAYREAEKAMIAAKAIASVDGQSTTDPGFLEAKARIKALFELPELQSVELPAANDAGVMSPANDASLDGAAVDARVGDVGHD